IELRSGGLPFPGWTHLAGAGIQWQAGLAELSPPSLRPALSRAGGGEHSVMKDRQAEPSPSQPRIPLLSTLLHCVSMTVVVFLRSGFGFAYFRPRSVFLAGIWAFALFTVYAWNEPAVWQWSASLCVF